MLLFDFDNLWFCLLQAPYNTENTRPKDIMIRIAEKLEFQKGALVGVRQRNDSPWPNSCFDYYFGRNSLKMKLESLSF